MYLRQNIVETMQSWLGITGNSTGHKNIIAIYNSYSPLPRGVKMTTAYAWCAATVSAAFIKNGYTALIPIECSCGKMITLAKGMGIWQESDAFAPAPGDIIFYDWSDKTGSVSDNTTGHDHVGIVETCDGKNITVIEGNYNNKVQRRNIKVNGNYIRGFITPKYDSVVVEKDNSDVLVQDDNFVWNALYNTIRNEYGVAGIMGNLKAESCVRSNNLQDSCASRLGISDETYTKQINNGTRDFIDNCGYGICQWTSASRKKNLKKYLDSKGLPIESLKGQLEFMIKELKETYPKTYETLVKAVTVEEASTRFMYYYEAPKNRGSKTVKDARKKNSEAYYEKFAKNKVFEEYHIAAKGESLSKIASKFGISLAEIKALNPWCKAPLYIVPLGKEVRVK